MNMYKKVFVSLNMLLLSICYVALSISFPSKWFRDRENYEIIAKYSNYFFYNLGDLSFTKEPVFLFINYLLTKITLFTNVPYFYVFFITSMMMFFLYKRSDNLLLFLLGLIALFIIPFTFHMQFVVLRQGIATVLFIYAIVCLKSNKTVLMLMLPLIHASFFFVLVLYYSYVFLKKYVSNILVISAIISIFSVVLFGVILGVAEYIGFYQLSYQDVLTIDSSGKAFVFNILILVFLILFCLDREDEISDLSIVFLSLYISLYYITPLIGRYMVTFLPFLILFLVKKNKLQNYILLILLILVYGYVSYSGALLQNSLLVNDYRELRF